tara:strand:+ start:177 stop:974 length:798 start_codon:yes stop_codon:yes gene_type:complete
VNEICSRFILKDVFDAYQDVYVSFETTSPIDNNNGLVIYAVDSSVDSGIGGELDYLPGPGLGLIPTGSVGDWFWYFDEPKNKTVNNFNIDYLAGNILIDWGDDNIESLPTNTDIDHTYLTNAGWNITSNIISVALDGIGMYGLKSRSNLIFPKGFTGNTGIDNVTPFSITTRAYRNDIPFSHLNTSTSMDILSSITPNTYRVRFKGYLNKVYVDVLQDRDYLNIYELNTNVKLSDIPKFIKIGFSYSGSSEFGLKNITYSGQISS